MADEVGADGIVVTRRRGARFGKDNGAVFVDQPVFGGVRGVSPIISFNFLEYVIKKSLADTRLARDLCDYKP
jgi:hypothetical protein